MKKGFRILRHSFMMVGRTLRSYRMLSVTIVLSFSLLLGYMGFVDSEIYNDYKHIFQINRGMLKVQEALGSPKGFQFLLEKAEEMENTDYYTVDYTYIPMSDHSFITEDGQELDPSYISTYFLSGYVWEFFYHFGEPYEIQWLDGKEHAYVDLKQGEAILDHGTYYALGLDQMEEPFYTFRFPNPTDGRVSEVPVQIVGLIQMDGPYANNSRPYFIEGDTGLAFNAEYNTMILLPRTAVSEETLEKFQLTRYAVFFTDQPEVIYRAAVDVGFDPALSNSIYRWQDDVLEIIQTEKGTKALITCAMLLILGINLYSSFSNALNERKFEIGVKRAIGASSFSIVRQFLYESMLVMVVNILISIALVVDIGLIYRLYMESGTGGYVDPTKYTYTLYISPHSAAMFAACSITLTVVFSLIFAYKSTQVQVIDYLKAE